MRGTKTISLPLWCLVGDHLLSIISISEHSTRERIECLPSTTSTTQRLAINILLPKEQRSMMWESSGALQEERGGSSHSPCRQMPTTTRLQTRLWQCLQAASSGGL